MNVIETSGLGKRYGGTWALRDCSLAIPMPMNAVAPMWMTDDSCPASICLAMDSAVSIGIA